MPSRTRSVISRLTTVVTCRAHDTGTLRQPINDCVNGDTYEVRVSYGFHLVTPLLNQYHRPRRSRLIARVPVTVLGDAFDPSGPRGPCLG